nr:MAG TPA: hypothetical protein [Caudoviricetes sp.]
MNLVVFLGSPLYDIINLTLRLHFQTVRSSLSKQRDTLIPLCEVRWLRFVSNIQTWIYASSSCLKIKLSLGLQRTPPRTKRGLNDTAIRVGSLIP